MLRSMLCDFFPVLLTFPFNSLYTDFRLDIIPCTFTARKFSLHPIQWGNRKVKIEMTMGLILTENTGVCSVFTSFQTQKDDTQL